MPNRDLFFASKPKARATTVALGWCLVLVVAFFSLAPIPAIIPLEQADKVWHVFAYLVLMLWFANLYPAPHHRIRCATALVFLGVLLEFLQSWSGYRSLDVMDMMAGTIGVVVGWILASPRSGLR